ncbi:MAG: M20/M25/M40 family metallo-hydrolase, partial [Deltaproteobacteria bacterium]|nr:M20/M25/M40 family metallo-hydrolase [Deltaproteobacteria bacterium]
MRSLLACLLIAGCSGNARDTGETGTQFITIGADALPTLRSMTSAQIIESDGVIAVAAIDARDLEALSSRMHQEHHRCGGYALHDSVIEAHDFLRPAIMAAPIEYPIDRGEVVKAVLPKLSEATILTTIGELQAMKNRYYRSASGAAASLWLQERWRSFIPAHRKDITVELFDHGYPQKSVIMTIPGKGRASEVVVIGGHLDSIAPGGTSSRAPGADDDASGIATLSEVARVLLASDFQPERTIKFMGYAAEEVGLRGSLSIAKDFKKRNIDVVGVLQLDMTNYQGSAADIWIITDFTSHVQNTFLTKLIETYVGATWGFDKCGYACSDHASWHRNGFAASMPFESRSREMNRSIHTDKDTLERSNNNAAHAIKFARLGASYAIELAKGEL